MPDYVKEIAALLNRHSVENDSNTPDFIMAEFVSKCLDAFNNAVRERERWYGRTHDARKAEGQRPGWVPGDAEPPPSGPTDTERLEAIEGWLREAGVHRFIKLGDKTTFLREAAGWCVWWPGDDEDCLVDGGTWREAIDAAMAAQQADRKADATEGDEAAQA